MVDRTCTTLYVHNYYLHCDYILSVSFDVSKLSFPFQRPPIADPPNTSGPPPPPPVGGDRSPMVTRATIQTNG